MRVSLTLLWTCRTGRTSTPELTVEVIVSPPSPVTQDRKNINTWTYSWSYCFPTQPCDPGQEEHQHLNLQLKLLFPHPALWPRAGRTSTPELTVEVIVSPPSPVTQDRKNINTWTYSWSYCFPTQPCDPGQEEHQHLNLQLKLLFPHPALWPRTGRTSTPELTVEVIVSPPSPVTQGRKNINTWTYSWSYCFPTQPCDPGQEEHQHLNLQLKLLFPHPALWPRAGRTSTPELTVEVIVSPPSPVTQDRKNINTWTYSWSYCFPTQPCDPGQEEHQHLNLQLKLLFPHPALWPRTGRTSTPELTVEVIVSPPSPVTQDRKNINTWTYSWSYCFPTQPCDPGQEEHQHLNLQLKLLFHQPVTHIISLLSTCTASGHI